MRGRYPQGLENQLFENFIEFATSRAKRVGLGLAICRAIVEAHGGAFRRKTANGRRCLFVYDPLGSRAASAGPEESVGIVD